jgi:hypothetical protein
MTAILLVVLALLIVVAGLFMPTLRDTLVFKPRRDLAEAVVLQVAARETALRKTKGHYEPFTPGDAPMHLPVLGISSQNWPSDDFLFEARMMPDSRLRIRALPRPEAVQQLRVGAQMFVAELAPSGGIARSGWYP